MKRKRRPFFAGYVPWRPLLPAAIVAAAGFSLELTVLAWSANGGLWSAALAVAVGTLCAWGEARGADRARVELAIQLQGHGSPALALGPRAPFLLLVALTLETFARALGEAALPLEAPRHAGGPSSVEVVLLGALAFLATRALARLWTLKRGAVVQSALADHGFAAPGVLASLALAAAALFATSIEPWSLGFVLLAALVVLSIADFALVRRHGTDVFAVLAAQD